MRASATEQSLFSLELVAMVCVIAISSWHVGSYMATFDGWIMATIRGATLGFCNLLMAHNIFKPNSTSRFPSFCGLIFFACTSTYMQYTYFSADPAIGNAHLMEINLDALALGVWAPAAEILLGWIHAAGLKQPSSRRSTRSTSSRFGRIGEALTNRIEQQLNTANTTGDRSIERRLREPTSSIRSSEHDLDRPSASGRQHVERRILNGNLPPYSVHLNGGGEHDGDGYDSSNTILNGDLNVQFEQQRLSKSEAVEQLLIAYRANPSASYDEVTQVIGRSKGTVANYVKELKTNGQIRITDDGVQVTV